MSAETESLVRCLDQQRESVLGIVGGLPEAALRRAVFPSGWTCLGLIHHLAVDDERYWFRGVAAAEPIGLPADEDSGWLAGPQIAAEEVFRLYREEIARADAIIAATPLEAPARRRDPRWDTWGWPGPAETVNLRGSFSTAAPAWADRHAAGAGSAGVTSCHHAAHHAMCDRLGGLPPRLLNWAGSAREIRR